MSFAERGDSVAQEYERHRRSVMGMLAKRFPRFDENERLEIYHEAWTRVFVKRRRGEEIQSLRAYLMQTAAAEAMNAVSRGRPPTPVGPDDPAVTGLADESPTVEDSVVIRDQARLARELIGSLDRRHRDLFKLRWDLQLSAGEIRSALDLSHRQYQRLTEEGAEAIAARVRELDDGTWSRRQRSLLAACLVEVTVGDEVRDGIASKQQRAEAQRLLNSDPHFAALYTEVHGALRRAAAILPLPLFEVGEPRFPSWLVDRVVAVGDRLEGLFDTARRESAALYLRMSDAAALASSGAATATLAAVGCIGVGGGAYYAVEGAADPAAPVIRSTTREALPKTATKQTAAARRAEVTAKRAIKRVRSAPSPGAGASSAQSPSEVPPPQPAPAPPAAQAAPQAPTAPETSTPTPQPSRPTSEFDFEN